MGFFSWNCRGCDHPLLSRYATNRVNAWMEEVAVIAHTGTLLVGFYDGYGRVDVTVHGNGKGTTIPTLGCRREPSVWHRRCWENAGSPKEYVPSASSDDQGYFFSPGAHDMKEAPKKKQPGPQ